MEFSPEVRPACPQTERQVALPSPEYLAHIRVHDCQTAEAEHRPAGKKTRWFCQKWKVTRGSCGLSFIQAQGIMLRSKDIMSAIVFSGGITSQLPDLLGGIVRGRLWTWTISRATGQFPLLYKESGWLFLRLQRGKEDIFKEDVNLHRTCGFIKKKKKKKENNTHTHARCSPLVVCRFYPWTWRSGTRPSPVCRVCEWALARSGAASSIPAG